MKRQTDHVMKFVELVELMMSEVVSVLTAVNVLEGLDSGLVLGQVVQDGRRRLLVGQRQILQLRHVHG